MQFDPIQLKRTGVVNCTGAIEDVFPLLCPKREEDWIPGWQCQTIWSKTGYNEEGAIFRTTKPYGTELYWTTLQYDIRNKIVDFLIAAPRLFMFRFTITLHPDEGHSLMLEFTQVFTSVSAEGNAFLERYRGEDFAGRLKDLERLLNHHLETKSASR